MVTLEFGRRIMFLVEKFVEVNSTVYMASMKAFIGFFPPVEKNN